MLDFNWPEIAVVILLAILVLKPEDVPVVLRNMGKWARKLSNLTRTLLEELEASMEQSATPREEPKVKSRKAPQK